MKFYYLILIMSSYIFGCTKTSDTTPCIPMKLVDELSTEMNVVNIIELNYDQDCLEVKFGYSGCDNDHQIDLLSDNKFLYSNPPQVYFQLVDQNIELCLAYFTQTESYDISKVTDLLNPGEQLLIQFLQSDKSILITK